MPSQSTAPSTTSTTSTATVATTQSPTPVATQPASTPKPKKPKKTAPEELLQEVSFKRFIFEEQLRENEVKKRILVEIEYLDDAGDVQTQIVALPLTFEYNLATKTISVEKIRNYGGFNNDDFFMSKEHGRTYNLKNINFLHRGLLFAYTPKSERTKIEKYFSATNTESIFMFNRKADNNNIISFMPDPKDMTIKAEYTFANADMIASRTRPAEKETDPKTHRGVIAASQELAIRGIFGKAFGKDVRIDAEGQMKQEVTIQKLASFLFKTPGEENAASPAEYAHFRELFLKEGDLFEDQAVKDAKSHGYDVLKEKAQSEMPLDGMAEALGNVAIPWKFADYLENFTKSKPVYIDYSANGDDDILAATKDLNVIPKVLRGGKEENKTAIVTERADAAMGEISDLKKRQMTLMQLETLSTESYDKLRNPKNQGIINSIGYISKGNEFGELLYRIGTLANVRDEAKVGGLLFISLGDSESDLVDYVTNDLTKGGYGIPAKINGEYFYIHRSDTARPSEGKEQDRGEREKHAKALIACIVEDDITGTINKTLTSKDINFDTRVKYVHALKELQDKAVYAYTNTKRRMDLSKAVESAIVEVANKVPNIDKIEEIVENIDRNTIFQTFTNISPTDKVFPNIQVIGAPKVSLKNIAESPFLSLYYLRLNDLSKTIKDLMRENRMTIPSVEPYEFDLIYPKNNVLPDEKKDIEIDPTHKNGIINLRTFPTVIKVGEELEKEKFLEIGAYAIGRVFGQTDPKDIEIIRKGMEENYKGFIDRAEKVILKSETELNNGNMEKKEKFVFIDKNYEEINGAVINIPIFEFQKELEERGMLKKTDRIKHASFRKQDIDNVFEAIINNTAKGIMNEKHIFDTIKDNYAGIIGSVNKAMAPKSFFPLTKEFIGTGKNKEHEDKKEAFIKKISQNGLAKEISVIAKIAGKSPMDIANEAFKAVYGDKALSIEEINLKQQTVDFLTIAQKGKTEVQVENFASKLKTSGLSKAMLKFMKDKPLKPYDIVNKAFKNAYGDIEQDFTAIKAKEKVEEFIHSTFVGNEHKYYENKTAIERTKQILKSTVFKDFPAEIAEKLSKEISGTLAEESVKDFYIQDSALSLINGYAFIDYVSRKKNLAKADGRNELSSQEKSDMLASFLTHVFKLRPHQVKQTMGTLALYLSGKSTVSHVWWLMRTGKTAAALSTLLLIAWTTESNSAFFIQKKNFLDILNQLYRIWPLALMHDTTILGPNEKYNKEVSKVPLAITDWIYKNIPVALKDKVKDGKQKILVNPIANSSEAPAEILSRGFSKDMGVILEHSKYISDSEFKAIMKKNSELIDARECFSGVDIPQGVATEAINKAFYFYIVKLIKEDYLAPVKMGTPELKIVKNIYESFWKDYIEELNKERKKSGGLILIGKEYISSFDAQEERENILKPKGAGLPTIKTDLDIDMIEEKITDKKTGVKEIKTFLDSLGFSKEEMPEDNQALLPKMNHGKKLKKVAVVVENTVMKDFRAELTEKVAEVVFGDDSPEMDEIREELVKFFDQKIHYLSDTLHLVWTGPDSPEKKNEGLFYYQKDGNPQDGVLLDIEIILKNHLSMLSAMTPTQMGNALFLATVEKVMKDVLTNEEDIADTLTMSGYRIFARELIAPSTGMQTQMRSRFNTLTGNSSNASEIMFEWSFAKPADIILPGRMMNDDIKNGKFELTKINSRTMEADIKDPSTFSEVQVSPKKMYMSLMKGGGFSLTIMEATTIDMQGAKDIPFNRKNKEYSSSLRSSVLWTLEEVTRIKSVGIDEIHKTITGKSRLPATQLGQAGGNCDKEEYKHLKTHQSFLTGTPYAGNLGSFGSLITTDATPEMAKTLSREIKKHCGNYKIQDQTIEFLLSRKYHPETLEGHVADAIIGAIKKIEKDGVKVNIYTEAMELKNILLTDPLVHKAFLHFNSENDFDAFPTHDKMTRTLELMLKETCRTALVDIKEKARAVADEKVAELRKTAREKKFPMPPKEDLVKIREGVLRDEISAFEPGIKSIEDAVTSGNTQMATLAPGLSNIVAMSLLTYYSNSQISIKSLSDKTKYTVLDSKDLETRRDQGVALEEDEEVILAFQDIIANYRRRYAIDSVYHTFEGILDIAVKALKDNSQKLLGKNTKEINTLLNKSQSSNNDSILDYIRFMTKGSETPPEEKMEAINKLIEIMGHIIATQKDRIHMLRGSLNDNESGEIEALPGLNIEVSVEDIKNISFALNVKGVRHEIAHYRDAISGVAANQGKQFVAFTLDGLKRVECGAHGTVLHEEEILYHTNMSIQPFADLPAVDSSINIGYDDEASIINVAAAINKVKDKVKEHILNSENTRSMTTRTDITKYAVIATIQALLERREKSLVHHVFINETSQDISGFAAQFMRKGTELKDLLDKNNIVVKGIETNDLETLVDPILSKGEKLHFIGNIGSSAEGVNNDYIQMGMFLGRLKDPNVTTQSVARQTGNRQDESKFYFFGGGGVFHKLSAEVINKNDLLNAVKKGLTIRQDVPTKELNQKRFKGGDSVTDLTTIKISAASLVRGNLGAEENLKAANTFITGNPEMEDHSFAAADKKEEIRNKYMSLSVPRGRGSEEADMSDDAEVKNNLGAVEAENTGIRVFRLGDGDKIKERNLEEEEERKNTTAYVKMVGEEASDDVEALASGQKV